MGVGKPVVFGSWVIQVWICPLKTHKPLYLNNGLTIPLENLESTSTLPTSYLY